MSLYVSDERVTRIEVIENSADASTQSPDAHMPAKYGSNSKTKQHDRIIDDAVIYLTKD